MMAPWYLAFCFFAFYITRYVASGYHYTGDCAQIFLSVLNGDAILTFDPSRSLYHFFSEAPFLIASRLGLFDLLPSTYALTYWLWAFSSLFLTIFLLGRKHLPYLTFYILTLTTLVCWAPTLYENSYSLLFFMPCSLYFFSGTKKEKLKDIISFFLLLAPIFIHQASIFYYGLLVVILIKRKLSGEIFEFRDLVVLSISVIGIVATIYFSITAHSQQFSNGFISTMLNFEHSFYLLSLVIFILSFMSKKVYLAGILASTTVLILSSFYDYQNSYNQYFSRVFILPAICLLTLFLTICSKEKIFLVLQNATKLSPFYVILVILLSLGTFNRWNKYLSALAVDLSNEKLPHLVIMNENNEPLKISEQGEYKDNWAISAQSIILQSFMEKNEVRRVITNTYTPTKEGVHLTRILLNNILNANSIKGVRVNENLIREVKHSIHNINRTAP